MEEGLRRIERQPRSAAARAGYDEVGVEQKGVHCVTYPALYQHDYPYSGHIATICQGHRGRAPAPP